MGRKKLWFEISEGELPVPVLEVLDSQAELSRYPDSSALFRRVDGNYLLKVMIPENKVKELKMRGLWLIVRGALVAGREDAEIVDSISFKRNTEQKPPFTPANKVLGPAGPEVSLDAEFGEDLPDDEREEEEEAEEEEEPEEE